MFQTSVLNQYYPIELYRKYGDTSLNTLIEQLFQGGIEIKLVSLLGNSNKENNVNFTDSNEK